MIREPDFVGRGVELTELAEAVGTIVPDDARPESETATDGGERSAQIRFLAVVGAPGAGKSTLLQRLVALHGERHGDDATCYARAAQWDREVPGAVLQQLLQRDGTPDALSTELEARWATGDPLLLVVDDADRADPESLRALVDISRRHRDRPVTVVLGGVVVPDIDEPVAQLPLTGLRPEAVAELAHRRGLILHPSMAGRLCRHTDGNPRAVLSLLDQVSPTLWAQTGADLPAPGYLRDEVAAALDGLSPDARSLAEALAIVDQPDDAVTVVELAGLTDRFAATDELIAAGLVLPTTALDPSAAAPRLRDDMVRAAIIGELGQAAAAEAHRRAATLIKDPLRRLHHLVSAATGPDPALADALERHADARASVGAWADVARLLRQAARVTADEERRNHQLVRAVDALLAAGDGAGATALIPMVESLRETPLRGATLAYLAILRGRAAEARLRLDRAWDIVNPEREPDVAALIAQRSVLDSLLRGNGTGLLHWISQAVDLAGPDSIPGVEASAMQGLGAAWSGRPVEGLTAARALTDSIRHGAQAQRATMGRGWLELGLDEIDEARTSLETAVSMAALGGSNRITLWSLAWLARVHFVTGEWDDAVRVARHGLMLGRTSGIVLCDALLNWTLAQVFSMRGQWEAADQAVTDASAGSSDYEVMRIPAMLARAQLAEANTDYATVIHTLSPLVGLAERTEALSEPGFWPWVDVLANALVVQGRLDEADRLLAPHETVARSRGHRSALARLGYARGRLLGTAGDIHSARKRFEESLDLLETTADRYDLTRVNFAYGQTLRRAGKRAEADRVIGTARDLYRALGAETYVARCDRELKAGGVRQRRGERHDAELTPQEEAVVALVIRGMTNREVAAELFISPKTVQYHLTRIYAKLGVRSRAELVAARV